MQRCPVKAGPDAGTFPLECCHKWALPYEASMGLLEYQR
jgi:hypothetical protein